MLNSQSGSGFGRQSHPLQQYSSPESSREKVIQRLPPETCEAHRESEGSKPPLGKMGVRWKYLLPRAVAVTLFWAALTFGFEPVLKLGITQGGGAVLQTTVGMHDLQSDFFDTSLTIQRLQVVDRDDASQNSVSVQEIEIDFDRNALLHKKCVINEAKLSGIRWNTASTIAPKQKSNDTGTSWSVPFAEQAKQVGDYAAQSSKKVFADLLEQTIAEYHPDNLETVQLGKQKEADWQARFDSYETRSEDFKKRVDQLKEEIEAGKRGNPLDHLQRYAQIAREVDRLLAEGKLLKQEFVQLPEIARSDVDQLAAAKERDLAKLKKTIDAIPLSGSELTTAILGPEISRQFAEIAGWVGFVQKCMSVAGADYEPARPAGRQINFDTTGNTPSFLVKRFELDGVARNDGRDIPFAGLVTNITHNPRRLQQPSQVQFTLVDRAEIKIQGEIDLTKKRPACELLCLMETNQFPQQSLLKSEKCQLALQTGKLKSLMTLSLTGAEVNAHVQWKQSDVQFVTDSQLELTQPQLAKLGFQPFDPLSLWSQATSDIDEIQGEVFLTGTLTAPKFALHSDLGDKLSKRIHRGVQQEWTARQQEAKLIAQQKIDQQLNRVTSIINTEYSSLLAEIKQHELMANGLLEKVAVRPASGVASDLMKKFLR